MREECQVLHHYWEWMAGEKKQKKRGNSYSHFEIRGIVVDAEITDCYGLLSTPSMDFITIPFEHHMEASLAILQTRKLETQR